MKTTMIITGRFQKRIYKKYTRVSGERLCTDIFLIFETDDGYQLNTRVNKEIYSELNFQQRYVIKGAIGCYKKKDVPKEEAETFLVPKSISKEVTGEFQTNRVSLDGYFLTNDESNNDIHHIAINERVDKRIRNKYIKLKYRGNYINKGDHVIIRGGIIEERGNLVVKVTDLTEMKKHREEILACIKI